MRGYLECMGVTELAIEAHEKGEADVSFLYLCFFRCILS